MFLQTHSTELNWHEVSVERLVYIWAKALAQCKPNDIWILGDHTLEDTETELHGLIIVSNCMIGGNSRHLKTKSPFLSVSLIDIIHWIIRGTI